MRTDTVERLRALMAEAAASPGKTVTIPADLAADMAAEHHARTREAILEIRQREYMPSRDGPPPAWVTSGVPASAAPSIKPEPRKATLMLPVYVGNVKSGRIADAVSAALLGAGIEVDRIEVGMPRPDGVDLGDGRKQP